MKTCCETGKLVEEMTAVERLGCHHDQCVGVKELEKKLIIYAVVQHCYTGAWLETDYDKFFTTKDKADLRRASLQKKNKDKNIEYTVSLVEVGE